MISQPRNGREKQRSVHQAEHRREKHRSVGYGHGEEVVATVGGAGRVDAASTPSHVGLAGHSGCVDVSTHHCRREIEQLGARVAAELCAVKRMFFACVSFGVLDT